MPRIYIKQKDIIEKFVRSQGHGGQNINKRSTCVYLKHLPTKIEVKCHQSRSQARNRTLAYNLLKQKIKALFEKEKEEEQKHEEKVRRQKRKRSKKAKEKILKEKKIIANKKKYRKNINEDYRD